MQLAGQLAWRSSFVVHFPGVASLSSRIRWPNHTRTVIRKSIAKYFSRIVGPTLSIREINADYPSWVEHQSLAILIFRIGRVGLAVRAKYFAMLLFMALSM